MVLHYGIIAVAAITDRFLHAVIEAGDTIEAIASRSLVKAQAKAVAYGVRKAYGAYEQVYTDPDVDIVYIAVNNANHGKEIKAALHHGKHVVCEKPIALSCEEAKELFALAKQKQLFLMEAQKSLFLPVTQDIRDILQKQTLGKLDVYKRQALSRYFCKSISRCFARFFGCMRMPMGIALRRMRCITSAFISV